MLKRPLGLEKELWVKGGVWVTIRDTTGTGGGQRCDCTPCTSPLIQKWRKWSVLCYVYLSTVLKTGKSGWECLGQEPERKGECRTLPEEQETERSQETEWDVYSALGRQWPCVHARSLQLCLTLQPYGLCPTRLHEILQARTLEWVAISPSRGWSRLGGQTQVSCSGRWVPYLWRHWE